MNDRTREYARDIFILLIIMMIGILLRLPIGNISNVDVTRLNDPDSFFYARKAIELYSTPLSEWDLFFYRADDPLTNVVNSNDRFGIPLLLPACIAFISKVFSSASIDFLICYATMFIAAFSAIPAFFFVKKNSNIYGGIIAALLLVLTPSYFIHTSFGYFDTDGIIMLLAVSFMICSIEILVQKNTGKQVILAVLSFVLLCLFHLSWSMYYAYVAVAVIVTTAVLIYNHFRIKSEHFIVPAISSFCNLIFCFIVSGKEILSSIISIFLPSSNSDWPPAGKFIGELEVPKLVWTSPNTAFITTKIGLVNFTGGLPFFILLGFSFVFCIIKVFMKKETSFPKEKYATNIIMLSLVVWLIVVSPLVLKGIRFVQLLALPACLLVGFVAGIILDKDYSTEFVGLKKDFLVILLAFLLGGSFMVINGYFAIAIALLSLFIGLISANFSVKTIVVAFFIPTFVCLMVDSYYSIKHTSPYIPDNIYNAVENIKDDMPENSCVVSWWDIGYYLQYSTNRQVVSDGGIYNGEYFYWLANIFTTDDPNLSIGICNMLKGGSLDASKIARTHTNSDKESVELLKDILVLDKSDALDLLIKKYGFTEFDANDLIVCSHPDIDKEMYLIISQDTALKAGTIAYFGLWDFKDEKIYSVDFDNENSEMIFPKELKDSVLLKLYFDEKMEGFELVYSKDSAKVFILE